MRGLEGKRSFGYEGELSEPLSRIASSRKDQKSPASTAIPRAASWRHAT